MERWKLIRDVLTFGVGASAFLYQIVILGPPYDPVGLTASAAWAGISLALRTDERGRRGGNG